MDNRVKKSYILLASVVAVVVLPHRRGSFCRKTAVAMSTERITRKAFLDKLESRFAQIPRR